MKYPKSPAEKVGGLVYFGRMVEKIRLHQAGELHTELHANLGKGFDQTCLTFLGVSYEDLCREIALGIDDDAALEWCFSHGKRPTEQEIHVWNEFMRKSAWNDALSEILARRKRESGFESRDDIQTMFQYIDADEGRTI